VTAAGPNWFDAGGADYARYRPDYPQALADHLADIAPRRRAALDVGCGTGQFTCQLAAQFETVSGLDPSADQIAHATPHPRVRYAVGHAEETGQQGRAFDLVTAAQAAHWFDLPRFYAEARRVAAPDALLALISYGVAQLDPDLAGRFLHFYTTEIGPYWPPERRMVDEGYAGIAFPFPELPAPRLDIVREWSLADFLGYVSTWSAVRRAREAGKEALLVAFAQDLRELWGEAGTMRTIRWPVVARIGRIG